MFSEASFEFSRGLNVITGENDTGKSHVLKLGYSVMHALRGVNDVIKSSRSVITSDGFNYILKTIEQEISTLEKSSAREKGARLEELKAYQRQVQEQQRSDSSAYSDPIQAHTAIPRDNLQGRLTNKLINVFKPDGLGRLSRTKIVRDRTEIMAEMLGGADGKGGRIRFSFSSDSHGDVTIDEDATSNYRGETPLFIPTHEVLTMPDLTQLYENRYMSIDETYYDLCKALKMPLIKGVHRELQEIVEPLEAVLNGKVIVDNTGRFYIDFPENGKREIPLIAEGLRKIATLIYLALNGSLAKGGVLFWDEAESNLNPKLIVKIAIALGSLAKRGIQVIVATHSLFLMKEFSLLAESESALPARFFNLKKRETELIVEQGDLLEDLGEVASLEQALHQDDREQAFYYREPS